MRALLFFKAEHRKRFVYQPVYHLPARGMYTNAQVFRSESKTKFHQTFGGGARSVVVTSCKVSSLLLHTHTDIHTPTHSHPHTHTDTPTPTHTHRHTHPPHCPPVLWCRDALRSHSVHNIYVASRCTVASESICPRGNSYNFLSAICPLPSLPHWLPVSPPLSLSLSYTHGCPGKQDVSRAPRCCRGQKLWRPTPRRGCELLFC